jgi:hypothetical protein
LGRILLRVAGGDLEKLRAGNANDWLLFHARDVEGASSESAAATTQPVIHPLSGISLDQSDLFSQKGLAILRSGSGENARAISLRVGPTLNHGHFDEMNLNVFARGYEMSYDLGYALASTHTQVGWAKQTASHNTVLVDENAAAPRRPLGRIRHRVRRPAGDSIRQRDRHGRVRVAEGDAVRPHCGDDRCVR